ncbi:MAG: GNAT family N-acetyltransferase [Streptosporangiales bacterium]|nr:GNAT family N-acetyltransferase [Streptosporangiales bacterium]
MVPSGVWVRVPPPAPRSRQGATVTTIRKATADDLPAIVEITRRAREQRASWEPEFFSPAAGADAAHEAYLGSLLDSSDAVARVVASGDEVVGCAFAVRQQDRWIVDDIATLDEGWWSDGMIELLRAVSERPAAMCVPRQHIRLVGCSTTVGLRPRSAYWRLSLAGTDTAPPADVETVAPPTELPAASLHTFAPTDPAAATVLADGSGGYAVLAPSTEAPPVYDPGGTTGLVDRVAGRRGSLVDAATAIAGTRRDAQLVVVCGEDDPVLEDALVDRGFRRVVDVYAWPTPSA